MHQINKNMEFLKKQIIKRSEIEDLENKSLEYLKISICKGLHQIQLIINVPHNKSTITRYLF